jgi:hypothetical protein
MFDQRCSFCKLSNLVNPQHCALPQVSMLSLCVFVVPQVLEPADKLPKQPRLVHLKALIASAEHMCVCLHVSSYCTRIVLQVLEPADKPPKQPRLGDAAAHEALQSYHANPHVSFMCSGILQVLEPAGKPPKQLWLVQCKAFFALRQTLYGCAMFVLRRCWSLLTSLPSSRAW